MSLLPTRDDLAVPATTEQIKQAWKDILRMPITLSTGQSFQFDIDSEQIMKKWAAYAAPTDIFEWRLEDNTTASVTPAQLTLIIQQCESSQVQRGIAVDPQYLLFKQNGATLRELETWKNAYTV